MIPTFVFGLPTGKEIGPYLAVDLGELVDSTFVAKKVILMYCIHGSGSMNLIIENRWYKLARVAC